MQKRPETDTAILKAPDGKYLLYGNGHCYATCDDLGHVGRLLNQMEGSNKAELIEARERLTECEAYQTLVENFWGNLQGLNED